MAGAASELVDRALPAGPQSLRRMLIEGFEPLTEPLDLVDDDGQPAGMLSVTLLARDALGRARRSSLRGPGTIEIWVGAETLLVAPTLRAALSNAALWLEIHLELGNVSTPSQQQHASDGGNKHEAPILHVASKRVRMPRSAPAGSGGLLHPRWRCVDASPALILGGSRAQRAQAW